MQNTLPQQPTSDAVLRQVQAMSQQSAAQNMLQPPAQPQQVAAQQSQPALLAPSTSDSPEERHFVEVFLEGLTEPDKRLYMAIRKDMISKQKLSILMVTGELSYIYSAMGVTVEFKLLSGKDKFNIDQYQFGRDPLNIFRDEDLPLIQQRMKDFAESSAEATKSFMEGQSMDSVTKRATLVTLAKAIVLLNGKKLGDTKPALLTIENWQAPFIQKLASVYMMFEQVVMHLLEDDNFIKN